MLLFAVGYVNITAIEAQTMSSFPALPGMPEHHDFAEESWVEVNVINKLTGLPLVMHKLDKFGNDDGEIKFQNYKAILDQNGSPLIPIVSKKGENRLFGEQTLLENLLSEQDYSYFDGKDYYQLRIKGGGIDLNSLRTLDGNLPKLIELEAVPLTEIKCNLTVVDIDGKEQRTNFILAPESWQSKVAKLKEVSFETKNHVPGLDNFSINNSLFRIQPLQLFPLLKRQGEQYVFEIVQNYGNTSKNHMPTLYDLMDNSPLRQEMPVLELVANQVRIEIIGFFDQNDPFTDLRPILAPARFTADGQISFDFDISSYFESYKIINIGQIEELNEYTFRLPVKLKTRYPSIPESWEKIEN